MCGYNLNNIAVLVDLVWSSWSYRSSWQTYFESLRLVRISSLRLIGYLEFASLSFTPTLYRRRVVYIHQPLTTNRDESQSLVVRIFEIIPWDSSNSNSTLNLSRGHMEHFFLYEKWGGGIFRNKLQWHLETRNSTHFLLRDFWLFWNYLIKTIYSLHY